MHMSNKGGGPSRLATVQELDELNEAIMMELNISLFTDTFTAKKRIQTIFDHRIFYHFDVYSMYHLFLNCFQ